MPGWKQTIALAALAVALGCVELVGQRISVSYDAEADELRILLFYDGIHDDPAHGQPGAEQLATFLRDGDFMFLDWYGHFSHERMERDRADPGTPSAQRALLAATLGSVQVTPLGVYRDLDGRIGAAQLLVVSHARAFVDAANAAISEAILDEVGGGYEGPWAATIARIGRAAEAGHAWLALDGHSLLVSFPVHGREWAALEASVATDALRAVERALGGGARDGDASRRLREDWLWLTRALTSAPLSLQQSADRVTVRVGTPEVPSTWRFDWDRNYEDNLAATLEAALRPLDPPLAALATSDDRAPDAADDALEAILRWGPPEERVRALIRAAEHDAGEAREDALRALRRFADRWNRESVIPAAPASSDAPAAELAAWKEWYGRMLTYPLEH